MLTTNEDDIAAYARCYQNRGRDMQSPVERYVMPGRNVRMTETAALFGRVQLSHLDEFLARRRRIAAIYGEALASVRQVRLLLPAKLEFSSFWKVPLILDRSIDRALLTERMAAAGIAVDSAYQPAMHLQPVFRDLYASAEGLLPRTEDILSRHLCLPCHPRMTDEDVVYVANKLKGAVSASAAAAQ